MTSRVTMIPERKGSLRMIPSTLRVPYHVKSKEDSDPGYLTRGGRGSKASQAMRRYERGLVNTKVFMEEVLGVKS